VDHGVSGVRSALIADDNLVVLAQEVHDFALGLVTPLQTHDASNRHGAAPPRLMKESMRIQRRKTAPIYPHIRLMVKWLENQGKSA
jgi:hypothetical protein